MEPGRSPDLSAWNSPWVCTHTLSSALALPVMPASQLGLGVHKVSIRHYRRFMTAHLMLQYL